MSDVHISRLLSIRGQANIAAFDQLPNDRKYSRVCTFLLLPVLQLTEDCLCTC